MIRIKQGTDVVLDAVLCGTTISTLALHELRSAQREYLLQCYAKSPPPRGHPRLTNRMSAHIRRIGVLTRENKEGLPDLHDILVPAPNWILGLECVLVRPGHNMGYIPLLCTPEALDPKATIRLELS